MRAFYGCYLLRSLDPAARVKTYIGFTVNPRRRIRQHNGEITSGAWRTRRGRPWEMVLVVYGFPTQVHALQFEWAWQHPKKSKVARQVLADIKTSHRTGLQGKVRLLLGLLNASPWRYYPLTLQFLVQELSTLPRGCAGLPDNLDVLVGRMSTLPTALHDTEEDEEPAAAAAEGEMPGSQSDADAADLCSSDSSSAASSSSSGSLAADWGTGLDELLTQTQLEQQQQQQLGMGLVAGGSNDGSVPGRRRRRQLSGGSSTGIDLLSSSSSEDEGSNATQQQQQPGAAGFELQPLSQRLQAAAAAAAAAGVGNKQGKARSPSPPAAAAAGKVKGKQRKPRSAAAAAAAGGADAEQDGVPQRGCGCCSKGLDAFVLACPACTAGFHTHCLAEAFAGQQQQQGAGSSSQPPPELPQEEAGSNGSSGCSVLSRRWLPAHGSCPCCGERLVWLDLLAAMKRFGGSKGATAGRKGRRKGKAAAAAAGSDGEASGSSGSRKVAKKPGRGSKKAAAAKGKGALAGGRTAAAAAAAGAAAKPRKAASQQSRGAAAAISRQPVIGAAAAAAAATATHVGADPDQQQQQGASNEQEQSALSALLHHLQQQYPRLQLPEDPQVLQQLLLKQPLSQHAAGTDDMSTLPTLQQQQQQQQGRQAGVTSWFSRGVGADPALPTTAVDHDAMDVCSDDQQSPAVPRSSRQLPPEQQQQQLGPGPESFTDWLDLQMQPQPSPQSQQRQQQQGALEVDLTSSPEPLLQRLRLGSPLKGKRTRAAGATSGVCAPAAAAAAGSFDAPHAGGPSRSNDISSSSDGGGSSDGSSPRRLAVRCRLNGTTPAAVVRSKARAAVTLPPGPSAAGGISSTGPVAAAAGVLQAPHVPGQLQHEPICLLDSD